MELRHLRYFVKCAELQHFTQASEALGVSQPTLSLQIQQLEEELGTPLFERVGRNVKLTSAGRLYLDHARTVLKEIEFGQQGIDELKGLLRGSLRIGVTSPFHRGLLPELLSHYTSLYPEVRLHVTKGTTPEIEKGLSDGVFELGFVLLSERAPNLEVKTLFHDDFVVAMAKGHPLAKSESLRARDLANVKLAVLTPDFTTRQLVDGFFQRARLTPKIAIETNDIDTLISVVQMGMAPTIALRHSVSGLKNTVVIALNEPRSKGRAAVLIWRKGVQTGTVASRFVDLAIQRIPELMTSFQPPS